MSSNNRKFSNSSFHISNNFTKKVKNKKETVRIKTNTNNNININDKSESILISKFPMSPQSQTQIKKTYFTNKVLF